MTRPVRQAWIESERRRILAEAGFNDIESPSGDIKQRQADGSLGEYYDAARALLHSRDWPDLFARQVWELHCEALSDHKIAAQLIGTRSGGARRRVGAVVQAIRAEMLGHAPPQRRRGRRRDPESLRAEGIYAGAWLTVHAVRALDTIRSAKRWSTAEIIRWSLGVAATYMQKNQTK